MADEPQREIEKRLAACAQERREQAGATPPLHPATRKMLQGEVSRVWPPQKPPLGFWAGLLALGWPRLALGLAVIILAGLMLSVFLPDRKSTPPTSKLALNSFSGEAAIGNRNPPQPAPQSADASKGTVLKTTREIATDKLNEPTHLGLHLADTTPASSAGESGNSQKDAEKTFSAETTNLRKLEMSKSFADQSALIPAAGIPPSGTQAPSPTRAPVGTTAGAASDTLTASGKIETPSPASIAAPAPSLPPPAPVQPAAPPALAAAPAEDGNIGAIGGAIGGRGGRGGAGGGGGGGFGGAANSPASQPSLAGQQFARVDTVAATRRLNYATGAANILNSFRVEQTGDQLRIIDSDGSIYLGAKISEVQKTPLAPVQAKETPAQVAGNFKESENFKKVAALDTPANTTASAPAGTFAAATPPLAPGFSFQVSGTNLTLNQPIVFTGRFLAAAPPPPPQSTAAASTVNPPAGQFPAGTPIDRLQSSKTRITGRLTLGTNQLDLTAEAAP